MKFRKSYTTIVVVSALSLLGAGCDQVVTKSNSPVSQPLTQADTANTKNGAAKSDLVKGRLLVTGVVTDELNGKPVPGARVYLKEFTKYFFADVEGRYRIDIPDFWFSSFTLTSGMAQYDVSEERALLFSPGREQRVDFSLNPVLPQEGFTLVVPEARYTPGDGAVNVRVIDRETGKAMAGVAVLVIHSSQGGKTDADGRVRLKIDPRYPDTSRVVLISSDGTTTTFPEPKNEYVIHFMPGYVTDITLAATLR